MSGFVFSDPGSLLAAVLAVTLVGLSKGGLGGAMSLLGMGVMSLVISPVQAAGILLPILIIMDVVSLWSWWGKWDLRTMRIMLPGALLGIGIGWLTAAMVSDGAVRLIVGVIALVFVARWALSSSASRNVAHPHRPGLALFWSTISGYTSFVAHAGGPPYQIYTMPLRMAPVVFTSTSVAVFAIVNVVKLVPYAALGQFDTGNLVTSAVLMPLAAVSTLIGAAIVRRIKAAVFYPLMYAMVLVVSVKLIWDGVWAL